MGIDLGRVGLAVATGGGSEVVREAYNQANKLTQAPGAEADRQEARDARSRLLNDYNNYQNRPAPQADNTGVAPTEKAPIVQAAPAATSAGAGFQMPAAQTTAQQAGPAQNIAAPNVAKARDVGVLGVGGSRIGNVERFGPSSANVVNAQAANINGAPQGEIRGGQTQLIGQLQGMAAGTGPSAAMAQYQQAMDRAIASQYSDAAGARGNNIAGARLQAGQNAGNMMAQSAAESAILKAQEQQGAISQLGGVLSNTRGQDIGMAESQAILQQGANLQNAALGTNVNVGNADRSQAAAATNAAAYNNMAQNQAQLDQGANLASKQMEMQGQLANQQSDLSRMNLRAQLEQGANLANQGVNTQNNQFNAAQGNTVGMANTAASNAQQNLNAQLNQQNNQFNAGATNQNNQFNANLLSGTNQFNAAATNQNNQFGSTLAQQTEIANLNARLQQEGYDDATRARLLQAYIQEQQNTMAMNQAEAGRRQMVLGGIINAGASAGSMMMGAPPGAVGGGAGEGAFGQQYVPDAARKV